MNFYRVTWVCRVCPGTSCKINYDPPDDVCYYSDGNRKPIWIKPNRRKRKSKEISYQQTILPRDDEHDRN
jgi:hypothetical protein